MNLRDALLHALAGLPGVRELHVHVLESAPKRCSGLFPFAAPRPKVFQQHLLLLLAEQPPDAPRVFVSAVEAVVYHLPSTDTAVLYVSKVDSTGQARHPSPTPALVRALLAYYLDPATRPLPVAHLWVHLFARAQSQYLFPNSAEYAGKRPLSDVKLCAWWRRQLSLVADEVRARAEAMQVRLHYLLPGLGELEASHALDRVYPSTGSVPWTYGHAYAQTDVPLPIGRGPQTHIGHVVPWFDDDPKARFLDEIAYTTDAEGVRSPERKRPRVERTSQVEAETKDKDRDRDDTAKALKKVSVDEFWERMSFRQECIAGAVTGFFVMATSCASPRRCESPLAPLPGQVSAQMVKRVLTSLMTGHEFASVERAVWSTRVLEEAIKGLCDGLEIVETQRGDSHRRTPERDGAASLAAPETPPRKTRAMDDVSPNPFPEPVACVETYDAYIYGRVAVRNAEAPRPPAAAGHAVTLLTARRKKRGRS